MSTGALGRLGRWGPPCSRRSADYRHVAGWLYGFGPTELGTPSLRLLRPKRVAHARGPSQVRRCRGWSEHGAACAVRRRTRASAGRLLASDGRAYGDRPVSSIARPTADRRPGPMSWVSRCQCSADRGRRESAAVSHAGRQWGGAVGWLLRGGAARRCWRGGRGRWRGGAGAAVPRCGATSWRGLMCLAGSGRASAGRGECGRRWAVRPGSGLGRGSCAPRWSAGRVHRRDACRRDAGGAHPADRWQRPGWRGDELAWDGRRGLGVTPLVGRSQPAGLLRCCCSAGTVDAGLSASRPVVG